MLSSEHAGERHRRDRAAAQTVRHHLARHRPSSDHQTAMRTARRTRTAAGCSASKRAINPGLAAACCPTAVADPGANGR
jgi:hypothetical protein